MTINHRNNNNPHTNTFSIQSRYKHENMYVCKHIIHKSKSRFVVISVNFKNRFRYRYLHSHAHFSVSCPRGLFGWTVLRVRVMTASPGPGLWSPVARFVSPELWVLSSWDFLSLLSAQCLASTLTRHFSENGIHEPGTPLVLWYYEKGTSSIFKLFVMYLSLRKLLQLLKYDKRVLKVAGKQSNIVWRFISKTVANFLKW